MDMKAVVHMEVKKNDRVYVFTMPMGSPYGEAYDAAFEMLQGIVEAAKKTADNMKQREEGSEATVEGSEEEENA